MMQDRDIIPLGRKLEWNKTNATLLYEEENIKLTKKEKRLMGFLCSSTSEYFIHDTLILHVWDDEIPDNHMIINYINLFIGLTKKSIE